MRRIVIFSIGVLFLTLHLMPSLKHFWHEQRKEKQVEPGERQLIDRVSGHNPRVKEIQTILSSQGIEVGEARGYMGQKTREGIKKFQQINNLTVTGVIDSAALSALEKIKSVSSGPNKEEIFPKASEEEATKRIEKYAELQGQKRLDIHDEVLNYRLQSKKRVRQIQMALQEAGYYKGEIDGNLGAWTKRAIKWFQKAKKLNPDGIVGEKTWEALSQYLKD